MTLHRTSGWLRVVLGATLALAGTTVASVHEVRVPLKEGSLSTSALTEYLMHQAHLPALNLDWMDAQVDLRGLRGNLYLRALHAALGEGFELSVEDSALVIRTSTRHLPRTWRQTKAATRTFIAEAAPGSTGAARRQWGLLLPTDLDPSRRLVILVHGLDCTRESWHSVSSLLEQEGHQVAYFSYPSDQPLDEDAALLAEQMQALRAVHPELRVSLVGHSMGALVCRAYLEGDAYLGGVDQLILIAPPNGGSSWASYRLLAEAHEHWTLFRRNADWSPSWLLIDGLGEAGADLKPGSAFLARLNALPRRESVRYTIIVGDRNPLTNLAADAIDSARHRIPRSINGWWGVRHAGAVADRWSNHLRHRPSDGDGPVAIGDARLEGVEDFVILPGDHASLYRSNGDHPPIAWPTIRQRLAQPGPLVAPPPKPRP